MTKRTLVFYALFVLLITVLYTLCVPGAIRQMEGSDFFIWDTNFFLSKLESAPGITGWLNNYLLQFFRWPIVGAFITSIILAFAALFCALIPSAIGKKGYSEIGLICSVILLVLVPFNIEVYLQAFCFFGILVGGLRIHQPLFKSCYLVLFSIIGFFLIPWALLVWAILVIVIQANLNKRNVPVLISGIIALALSVVTIHLSSEWIGFIPFEHRYLYSPSPVIGVGLFVTLFVVATLLMFLPRKDRKGWSAWLPGILTILVVGVCLVKQIKSDTIVYTEKYYRYADLAEQKQWKTLLAEIPHEETTENKVSLCYALLAESALGTLPENIFSYPIANPEDFLFRHDMKKSSCLFNRQFYENLEIYDEAFRQAFEYGVMTPEGTCFSSLRQMIHYAILEGDLSIANKYLHILELSSLNGSWIKQERDFMKNHPHSKQKKASFKDTFVSVYPINSEIVRQMEYNPHNKKALDYLLTGLLMQRELQKFAIIINGFPVYKGKTLPKAYAEAGAMFVADAKYNLHQNFVYSPDYDERFKQFYATQQRSQDASEFASYMNSYWYYYFFAQPEGQSNDENQVSKPTS